MLIDAAEMTDTQAVLHRMSVEIDKAIETATVQLEALQRRGELDERPDGITIDDLVYEAVTSVVEDGYEYDE